MRALAVAPVSAMAPLLRTADVSLDASATTMFEVTGEFVSAPSIACASSLIAAVRLCMVSLDVATSTAGDATASTAEGAIAAMFESSGFDRRSASGD